MAYILSKINEAEEEDDVPYIEMLPEYWGELCRTPELASRWADDLIHPVRIGPRKEWLGAAVSRVLPPV